MIKWEYCIYTNLLSLADLNALGQHGWELLSGTNDVAIFKRPLQEDFQQTSPSVEMKKED